MKSVDWLKSATQPLVFYVTDAQSLPAGSENILDRIRIAVAAGADGIQIRETGLPTAELMKLGREAIRIARDEAGHAKVIVNDRLDVALAADGDGVHLGRRSLPADRVIEWRLGKNSAAHFVVGVSCHSAEETLAAEKAGASYAFFGPIFDTPSKRAFGLPQGLTRLDEVCRAATIPIIAIGGINESNAAKCILAGATGIAAIRLFQETFEAALAALLRSIHEIPLLVRNS